MTRWTRRGAMAALMAASATGPVWARSRIRTGQPVWADSDPLPVRIQEIYPAVLDGRIYVAGGLEARNSPNVDAISDALFVSDPQAGWLRRAALPEPRHHPNLVGHAGAIHAFGGFRAGETGSWTMLANSTRYDPASDRWTEMRPMPSPYGETCAVSLAGHIHIATGRMPTGAANGQWNDHGDRGDHFVYDAGEDRWRDAAPNPTPRNSAAGVVLAGRLHIIGGRRVNAGNHAAHEAYDPAEDRWHSRAPLPQAQGGLAAAVVDNRIYAFGGEWFADGGGVYANCWIYDPDADAWSAGPDMVAPRHGLGGVAIGNQVFAIGGALRRGGGETSSLVQVLQA